MAKTTPKTTLEKPDAADSPVLQAASDEQYAAEALLLQLADQGGIDAYQSEHAGMFPHDWDYRRVEREIDRRRNIREMQKVAGSAAERRDCDERVESTSKTLSEKGPMIRQKIERLQAELQGLEQAAIDARKEQEARRKAVELMGKSVPDWFEEKLNLDRRRVNNRRATWLQKESKCNTIRAILALNLEERRHAEQMYRHCEANGRRECLDPRRVGDLRKDRVERYRDELRAELAEKEPLVEAGREQYAKDLRDLQARRESFYCEIFELPAE